MKRWDIGPHIADDILESYFMGRLPDREGASVEEHLLACESCQAQAEHAEEFILVTTAALRYGGRKPAARAAHSRGGTSLPPWFTFSLVSAAAVCAMAFLLVPARQPAGSASPVEVRLFAMRGPDSAVARAASGAKLVLDLEAEELPANVHYDVKVVNSRGVEVWAGQPERVANDLRITPDRVLRSGRYWIRVYNSGGLAREFGVQIE